MCDACQQKIRAIQNLAQFLRDSAAESQSLFYARMMNAAADDLDRVACHHADRGRCGECADDAAEDQAAASLSALSPPFATPTIAGRSSRSYST